MDRRRCLLAMTNITVDLSEQDFDSTIRRFDPSRSSQIFPQEMRDLGSVRRSTNRDFMLHRVAENFQAISRLANFCQGLHATWMQHDLQTLLSIDKLRII